MAIPHLAPQGQRNQSPPLWAATFPMGEGLGRVKTLPYKVAVIARSEATWQSPTLPCRGNGTKALPYGLSPSPNGKA